MHRRIAFALVLVAVGLALSPRSAAAHGDIPEADVSCTGPALLNDDLAPRSAPGTGTGAAHTHRVVSARAEILDTSGSPIGTFYLDDRGDRYVTLEASAGGTVLADFPTSASTTPGEAATSRDATSSGAPIALTRDFKLGDRYRLAACR